MAFRRDFQLRLLTGKFEPNPDTVERVKKIEAVLDKHDGRIRLRTGAH